MESDVDGSLQVLQGTIKGWYGCGVECEKVEVVVDFDFLFDATAGKGGNHRVDLSGDGILQNRRDSGFDDFLDLVNDQVVKCFAFDFDICVEVVDIYALYLHVEAQRFRAGRFIEHYSSVDFDLAHFDY